MPGRPKGNSGERTKTEIMDVAAGLFAKHDYADVNLRLIAREAGLSTSAIYNHFDSKDDLFSQIMLRIMSNTRQALTAAVNKPGSWSDRLGYVLDEAVKAYRDQNAGQILTSTSQIKMARESEKFGALLDARNEIGLVFQDIVRQAVESGELPPDVNVRLAGDMLMAFSFNAIGAVTLHWDPEKHIDEILSVFKLFVK
ncbi:transcriptional regulator, TetR family [Parasphingorhabdus marina DSM 22363]|uniref:Transcriptional regulator, TetR family n=1 Tax=Parasphingorhabdus marina DSM 22363 TaxID=1123272 RepID=A0A1N6DAM1_9SPHN|nr:TetR/AcrR family transcriptional regulator [Parasphingorhabdus marina]SIN67743.1 transcriptional regulator, TetR family [Parasphingorhabdus marina DSM 22363]